MDFLMIRESRMMNTHEIMTRRVFSGVDFDEASPLTVKGKLLSTIEVLPFSNRAESTYSPGSLIRMLMPGLPNSPYATGPAKTVVLPFEILTQTSENGT